MGRLAVLIFKGTVEGEVYLQDREVLEILGDALHRKDFFNEGVFPYRLGTLPDAALIAFLGIDLPQPAGVPVTSRVPSLIWGWRWRKMNFSISPLTSWVMVPV